VQKRDSTRRTRFAGLALALPVLLLACFVAARARASDPPPVLVEWHGPDDCQAPARVVAEVRRLLGGEHLGSSLVARAKATRAGRRWHLALTTDQGGHASTRQIDAESCGAAADAIAVILALTIDSSSAIAGDDDAGASASSTPPEATSSTARDAAAFPSVEAPPPESVPPDAPPPDSGEDGGAPPPFPLFLFGDLASDTGTLPHTGFGVRGGLGLSVGPLALEARVGYWPNVSTQVGASNFTSLGGTFSMVAGDLRACVLATAGTVSFGPCAGAGITSMRGEGVGVTTPLKGEAEWGTFAADGLLRVRLSRFFALRLNGGVAVPFARPVFGVQGLGPVHQPAPVALQIGLGLELHF
jgi:hypothetical protein